jgi:hypothetical protein
MKTLWAKTEKRIEFPIEIQPGQEYYIRCGVDMGAFVGRPSIEIVDSRTGKYEFDAIKSKTSGDRRTVGGDKRAIRDDRRVVGNDGRSVGDDGNDDRAGKPLVPANYRKGYAGVSVGPSLLLAEYSDINETGLQFNANFGYLFKKNIGVTASFLLTSYGAEDEDISVGLRGGLVGPVISFQNSSLKVEYDIRPTVGIASGKISGNNASLKTDKMTFMLGVGGSVRWNVADFISLTGNLDTYFHGEFDIVESLASIGMTVGVNFRF